ncbi:hypothetical protein BaRGS_00029953, partial [Batillaria attramentaria]
MDDPQSAGSTAQLCASYTGAMPDGATERILCTSPQRGRYFQVTLSSTETLTLCEVQVLSSYYEGERLVDFYVEVFAENPETAQDPGVLCYHYTDAVPGGATVTIHCPQTTNGRYVQIRKTGNTNLQLCEVQVLVLRTNDINCTFDADGICGYQQLTNDNYDWFRGIGRTASIATGPYRDHTTELVNVARDKPVTANNRLSSAYHEMNAVDGDNQKCFTSDETEAAPYLFVDLLRKYPVVGVVLTNRHDCCPTRLTNYVIEVFDDIPTASSATAETCATFAGSSSVLGEVLTVYCTQAVSGRYVKISKPAPSLQMCELEVLVMKPQ